MDIYRLVVNIFRIDRWRVSEKENKQKINIDFEMRSREICTQFCNYQTVVSCVFVGNF